MATKSISTVEKIMSGSALTGLIMQDESGFFYRPKGVNGLHKPGKDGQHFPTAKEAKASQAPGATSAPVKAPGKDPQAKAAPARATAPRMIKEPAKAAPGAPQAAYHLNAEASQAAADKLVSDSQEVAEAKAASAAPGNASKVRYKLVEALGETGTQYWLYPGYIRSQGFKWDAFGGSMFLALGAVEVFLFDNGISLTEDVEKVDIRQGHYDPNKGVTPHDEPNGQRRLI